MKSKRYKSFTLFFFFLLLMPLFVEGYDPRIEMFSDNIVSKLGNNTEAKVYQISSWVEMSVMYEFHWFQRGIDITWEELKGDCTDKAMLKQYMLYKQGVWSRLVRGYDGNGDKHDTLEYFYNNKWNHLESRFNKTGNGIW